MARLKIGPIADETPVKLAVTIPAAVHRDLVAYAEALSRETGQTAEAAQLVGPMLARFMATDRAFAKRRRSQKSAELGASASGHVSGMRPDESRER